MKIFNVVHIYDVDGGFGDAIRNEELVAVFASAEDADAFVAKYNRPYVYDRPYAELYCNQFVVVEVEVITHAEFDIDKTPEEYGAWIPLEMSLGDEDEEV